MLKSTIKHIQDIFAGLFLKTAKQVYKQTKLTTSSREKKTWNVFCWNVSQKKKLEMFFGNLFINSGKKKSVLKLPYLYKAIFQCLRTTYKASKNGCANNKSSCLDHLTALNRNPFLGRGILCCSSWSAT